MHSNSATLRHALRMAPMRRLRMNALDVYPCRASTRSLRGCVVIAGGGWRGRASCSEAKILERGARSDARARGCAGIHCEYECRREREKYEYLIHIRRECDCIVWDMYSMAMNKNA